MIENTIYSGLSAQDSGIMWTGRGGGDMQITLGTTSPVNKLLTDKPKCFLLNRRGSTLRIQSSHCIGMWLGRKFDNGFIEIVT